MDKRSKTILQATKISMNILEVGHWVALVLMVGALISALAAPQFLGNFVGLDTSGAVIPLSVYGFELEVPVVNGQLDTTTFALFAIGAILNFGLMAMVFRNLHLIIRKSDGTTPFQKDNVRMLKEIGIFFISVYLVGLIMSIVARLVLGWDMVETSVRVDGILTGLVVLCLTQYFAYGMKLQNDVDGLL